MPRRPARWLGGPSARRMRTIEPVRPTESARHDGLAYTLWMPERAAPTGGIVILHGAGSCKESHYDFARAALPLGLVSLAFDQRGHGESDGPMDDRVLDDVVAMVELLRERLGDARTAVALRGSSMGAYLAILSAEPAAARAVVAICPPPAEGLRRALEAGRLNFAADESSLDAFLSAHELDEAVSNLRIPMLLMHAEGDEQVPVQHSRELAERLHSEGSRLLVLPGGHHRSIQHDDELQAVSLRFVQKALAR